MDKHYEEKYQLLEETHPWFIGRRDIIKQLIKDFPKTSKILEIGCSGGALIKDLYELGYYSVTGIDISERAINLCRERGIREVAVMDARKPEFKDSAFDLIIASDILEHLAKDDEAIKNWGRILRTGGKIICFVPAFQFLWSNHDRTNHHYRRYTKNQLVALFKNNQFTILRSSYWNFTLFLPSLLIRKLTGLLTQKGQPREYLYNTGGTSSQILKSLLLLENRFLRKINYPFGVSVFLIAGK